MNAEVPNW